MMELQTNNDNGNAKKEIRFINKSAKGIPVVSVRIGSQGYVMMLDSGSEVTLFDADLARRLSLDGTKAELTIDNINGGMTRDSDRIHLDLAFPVTDGTEVIVGIDAFTVDTTPVGKPIIASNGFAPEFAGIIGSDTLGKLAAELDYCRRVMRV